MSPADPGTDSGEDPIRVVAFMEASTLTGPARNLIRFARRAREFREGLPRVDLSVATFCRGERSNAFVDALRSAGIEADIIPERSRFDFTSLRHMADIVGRRQPDIIQTHAVKSHFLLWLSRLWRNRPWIGFHHGYTAENVRMRLYNHLDRLSLPAARRVVTVCSPFAKDLGKAGIDSGKISVLHNCIDPPEPVRQEEAGNLRRSLGIAPGERVVLSIGRFSSEKAQADLVPAVAWLVRSNPGLRYRVVLVGDGVERERVTRAAAESGLSDRFLFTGQRVDVSAFYALADMFVLPSHSEGSPNVLLEAMAYGVPIAATSVGGVPETVDHNSTALLVRAGDAEALGAAMQRILTESGLASALAAAGLESVRSRFSPDAYRARLTDIYIGCLRSVTSR